MKCLDGIYKIVVLLFTLFCSLCMNKDYDDEDNLMMINALKSRNSCGHDDLSIIILKAIKHDICKPITLIINQSLYTGIFPNKLKLAKVIPIYKKGDNTKLDNYRLISILPAISKILTNYLNI